MANPIGKYDSLLHMFVQVPNRAVEPERLAFLRAYAELDPTEHPVSGVPSGQYADLVDPSMLNAARNALIRRLTMKSSTPSD